MLAWQYFGDRLNEGGCMGDAYVPTTLAFGQTIAMLERGQDPKVLEEARTQAETLWSEHGVRAHERKRLRVERGSAQRACAISCSSPLSSGLVPDG